jgi:hypothetical protein
MMKLELMQVLAEIPGDYPIVFKVSTDELLDETFAWMDMEKVVIEGVKEIYRREEWVFDDVDDLFDHISSHEDLENDIEIQKMVDATPRKKMIVIQLQS